MGGESGSTSAGSCKQHISIHKFTRKFIMTDFVGCINSEDKNQLFNVLLIVLLN